MIKFGIAFLVLLNPFALFIYLQPVMKDLAYPVFVKVLFRATLISFAIFYFFALAGEYVFNEIFQIRFDSFRIFGGIVFFTFALAFIVQGRKSLIQLKESLDDVASEIALPFMVGAGTLSLAILIGYKYSPLSSFSLILGVLLVNFATILLLIQLRVALKARLKTAFDKIMEMSMRLFGFFVGAIGVDMVVTGIKNIFFDS